MKGKKKWIIIAVIVVLALFGAVRGGGDKEKIDDSDAVQTESAAETNAAETDAEEPDDAQDAATDENTTEETAEDEAGADGIRPELREFLDSYEAYMDEYCEFMKNYNESDPTQLLKYAALMEKYYEFTEKAEAWDDTDMTDEESLYYLKVMNRVNEKLLETGVAVG